jgi:hypothetical protein
MTKLFTISLLSCVLLAQNIPLDYKDPFTVDLYRRAVLTTDQFQFYLLNPHLTYEIADFGAPDGFFRYLNRSDKTLGQSARLRYSIYTDESPAYSGQLGSFGYLTKKITVHNEMTLDSSLPRSGHYVGNDWRGLTGYSRRAFFHYSGERVRMLLGRDFIRFGTGKTGNLLFSPASRPFDQIRFQWVGDRFSINSYLIQLNNSDGQYRHVYAHRFSLAVTPQLVVSLTETALESRTGNGVELSLLNPFLVYHAEQMNGPDLTANTLGTIEIAWRPRPGLLTYVEFLLDDYQFDKEEPGDLEPNEIGGLIGIEMADFVIDNSQAGLELVAITNRTYKTLTESEWWLHRNDPIGYELGSDLFRVYGWLQVWLHEFSWVELSLDYLQRGEGEMDQPWDSPWDSYTVEEGYTEPFPTGEVETSITPKLDIHWIKVPYFELNGEVGYRMIRNEDHVIGEEGGGWFFSITLGANFGWGIL